MLSFIMDQTMKKIIILEFNYQMKSIITVARITQYMDKNLVYNKTKKLCFFRNFNYLGSF